MDPEISKNLSDPSDVKLNINGKNLPFHGNKLSLFLFLVPAIIAIAMVMYAITRNITESIIYSVVFLTLSYLLLIATALVIGVFAANSNKFGNMELFLGALVVSVGIILLLSPMLVFSKNDTQ